MKILVASDKFKGSLTASQVCNIIEKAIKKIDKDIDIILNPMADGGEGTLDTLIESLKGKYVPRKVKGPLGGIIQSKFGILKGSTAIIEMSSASGLMLLSPEKRNPLNTTTYGTGELIMKAIEIGCKKIIIGIGGSATNDGGMGMAQALGYEFLDKNGNLLGFGGKELIKLKKINSNNIKYNFKDLEIEVACDVDNPLTGENGASYIYGPQKGADIEMVKLLDEGLKNFAKVVLEYRGIDIDKIKGSGAAGGLGAGLIAFVNGKIRPGAQIIIEATGLENKIKNADLIITGEGSFDDQTFFGKSPYAVAELAQKYQKPVISLNGSINLSTKKVNKINRKLFCGIFSIINKPMELNEILENSEQLLENAAFELINFYMKITETENKKINILR
ncbi:MAG: glycerate kinase [Actinobacteria bacterium]|nr:glycerate kinase [Actinomycetota bacterium]